MQARIAVIGAGKYGALLLKIFSQLERENKAKFVAFAARTPETVRRQQEEFGIKGYTDYKKMLDSEDINAVAVVTPDHLHREITVHALKMGKHVLVEKPMDTSVEGCDEMISRAAEGDLLLQVDMHKRFDAYHRKLERLVKEGKLGRIQYGYAYGELRIILPRDWFSKWAENSSPAWIIGIHMFDLVRWILKSDTVRVYATGQKGKLTGLGINTYDSIQTKIEFENDASVTVDSSWIIPDRFEAHINQGIRLVGTEGMMEIDSQDRGARSLLNDEGMSTYNLGFMSEKKSIKGETVYYGYAVESIENFVENVNYLLNGGTLAGIEGRYPSGIDGLESAKIAAAAHRSIEEKRIIELKEFDS